MASPSIEKENSSEQLKDYFERLLRWLPNNINPDFVFVVSVFGIVINPIVMFTILLKFDQTNIVFSIDLFLQWVGDHFLELLAVISLLLSLLFSLIFSSIASRRILEENTKLKVPFEEFFNFANEPRVAKFAFQLFMITTGAILLRILADRGFPLQDTLQFMGAWFLLMLLFPTPNAAKTDVDPFNEEI